MSTRGSYSIGGMNLYVHHDNYPSGTACKFYETLKRFHRLDLFSFIRTVDEAEQCADLNKSGQEFCYKIEGDTIKCYAIDSKDNLILQSMDKIEVWVNREIKPALDDTDKPEDYHIIKTAWNRYYTDTQIKEEAINQYNKAVKFTDTGHIGNGSCAFCEAFKWANYLPENSELNALREEYKAKYSPIFRDAYKHADTSYFDSYADIKEIVYN